MPADLPSRHFSVAEGDELAVAQALAGPLINVEPICPMCGHRGASRLDEHRETGERVYIPCYLTWSGAHGVTAAVRNPSDMPLWGMVKNPDGAGWVSAAKRPSSVRCDECEYHSPASAFCRPTGPVYGGSVDA